MSMTPEARTSLLLEYMDGQLTDALLCQKYGLDAYQLKTAVYIGTGNIVKPEPVERGLKRGVRNSVAIGQLAADVLPPEDMRVSPLQAADTLEPDSRDKALFLNDAELAFANNVLRGMNATAAAAASFEIFNEPMARKKAAELLRSSHVAEYLASMKGKTLFAPVRNKAYLEAVLWQVIDRGLALTQSYDVLTGRPVEGKCDYNWKAVVSGATLLARLKGWDKLGEDQGSTDNQRDRLRRLQATFNESKAGKNE